MVKRAAARERRYWLFKSEPESYSIQHLKGEKKQTTFWSGVRNYQARNFLRDDIQVGDRVLFYHSNCDPLCIAGTAEVVRGGYPDPTAFDPEDSHFDAKSREDEPTWYVVDIRLLQIFPEPVSRSALAEEPALKEMVLLQRGSRLSIQPVTPAEWTAVHTLAGVEDQPG